MADLRRLYSSLGEDVDPTSLPVAATLRQRADRRARVAAVTATVAALVAVAGTLIAINVSLAASRSQSPATTAPTTSAANVSIPDVAFVTAPSNPAEGGTFLPETICGLAPTNESVITRRTRTIPWQGGASIHQTITIHRPDGAERFVLQMRTVTEGCTGNLEGGNLVDYHQVPWPSGPGDDWLLVERGTDPTGPRPRTISYLVVVRIGDVATVLNVYGGDGRNADRGAAENAAETAVAAIGRWRN